MQLPEELNEEAAPLEDLLGAEGLLGGGGLRRRMVVRDDGGGGWSLAECLGSTARL